MTEDLVSQITDEFTDSELSERYKAVVAFTDVVVGDPSLGMSKDLCEKLSSEFKPAQLAELAITAGMACGFSKLAIAWGPPPEMPLTELPTPTPKGTSNS